MRNLIPFVASDLALDDSEVNKKGSGLRLLARACVAGIAAAIASLLSAAPAWLKDGRLGSA